MFKTPDFSITAPTITLLLSLAILNACGIATSNLNVINASEIKIMIGEPDGLVDRYKFYLSAPLDHSGLTLCQIDQNGTCLVEATYTITNVTAVGSRNIMQASKLESNSSVHPTVKAGFQYLVTAKDANSAIVSRKFQVDLQTAAINLGSNDLTLLKKDGGSIKLSEAFGDAEYLMVYVSDGTCSSCQAFGKKIKGAEYFKNTNCNVATILSDSGLNPWINGVGADVAGFSYSTTENLMDLPTKYGFKKGSSQAFVLNRSGKGEGESVFHDYPQFIKNTCKSK